MLPLLVSLSTFAAKIKREIHEDLLAGRTPRVGAYDSELLHQSKVKLPAQMGTTNFLPDLIVLEFIYPDPLSSALVLPVSIEAPERIVYMPVPGWVVENIWQGSVEGSYHFESHAKELLDALLKLVQPDENARLFGPQMAKRRE